MMTRVRKYKILIFCLAAAWYLLLSNRGLNLTEEGSQYLHGWQIARGLVTYRDYFVPVAPVGYLIQAGLLRVFGFHLLVGRVYVLLQGLIIMAFALRIGRRRLEFPFSLGPALCFIPFSIALGSFPHYNLDSSFFLFGAVALLLEYLESPRRVWLFIAALLAGLAAGSKQSLVAAAVPLLVSAIWLTRDRAEPKQTFSALVIAGLGFSLPLLAIMFWLFRAHALEETWAALTHFSSAKRLTVFSLLPWAGLALGLALVLVRGLVWFTRKSSLAVGGWAALIIAAAAMIAFLPAQVAGPFLAGLVTMSLLVFTPLPTDGSASWRLLQVYGVWFFLLTLLSGLDLGHLLIAAMGAPFFAGLFLQTVFRRFSDGEGRPLRFVAVAGFVLLLGLGVYLDLGLPHLAHSKEAARWKDTVKVDLHGLEFMRTTPEQALELSSTVKWIQAHTSPADRVFVYPWDVLLYVLADRLPATYDTYLYYEIFDEKIVRRVVRDLDDHRPQVAVVAMDNDRIAHVTLAPVAAIIESYLLTNYQPAVRFGRYQLLTRKGGPPAAIPGAPP